MKIFDYIKNTISNNITKGSDIAVKYYLATNTSK